MNKNLAALCQEAAPWYAFNSANRHYHNWSHALRVVSGVNLITDDTPSDALLLAAYWHDAVYVPKAGADANERCSAAALLNASQKYTKLVHAAAKAADLILQTTIQYHLTRYKQTGDLAILLDADLASLADPYDEFFATQCAIITEAGGTYRTHRAQSAAFLKQFVGKFTRRHIYHTSFAQEHWEDAARENIKRYIFDSQVDVKSV